MNTNYLSDGNALSATGGRLILGTGRGARGTTGVLLLGNSVLRLVGLRLWPARNPSIIFLN